MMKDELVSRKSSLLQLVLQVIDEYLSCRDLLSEFLQQNMIYQDLEGRKGRYHLHAEALKASSAKLEIKSERNQISNVKRTMVTANECLSSKIQKKSKVKKRKDDVSKTLFISGFHLKKDTP